MEKKFWCKDRKLGIAIILIAGFFIWRSLLLPASKLYHDPGPGIYPLIGCGTMILCGLILILKPGPDGTRMKMNKDEKKRFWTMLAIYFGTVLGCWALGMMYILPITLYIVSYLFSKSSRPDMSTKKRLLTTLIYTVIIYAVIYVVYVIVLDVSVKNGVLLDLIF